MRTVKRWSVKSGHTKKKEMLSKIYRFHPRLQLLPAAVQCRAEQGPPAPGSLTHGGNRAHAREATVGTEGSSCPERRRALPAPSRSRGRPRPGRAVAAEGAVLLLVRRGQVSQVTEGTV